MFHFPEATPSQEDVLGNIPGGMMTLFHLPFRSLVATNDHLLQELEETRIRHAQEMTQMNINYDHLRKTVQLYS